MLVNLTERGIGCCPASSLLFSVVCHLPSWIATFPRFLNGHIWQVLTFMFCDAPAEAKGANLDRHLVPYHVKQGESNLATSLYIYLYASTAVLIRAPSEF